MLNGNGNSIKTYTDGIDIIKLFGFYTTALLPPLLVAKIEDKFMPSFGQSSILSQNKVTVFRNVQNGTGQSANLPFGINKNYPIYNFNSKGSMDAVQGSIYDATATVSDSFKVGFEKVKKVVAYQILKNPNHCFIPSASALAFKNNNFNWNDNVANRNLLCNNEIWFDNYFIPKTNEEHITLTAENAAWVTQEIEKGQPNCPKICSFSISGSDNLCIGTDVTYTLDVPFPLGCSIVWEPSVKYQIIASTNNTVTVRRIADGPDKIKAHIINPCGADMYITKDIFVGIPSYTASYKNGITENNQLALYLMNPTPQSYNNVCLGYNCTPNVYIESQPFGIDNVTWTTPNSYNDITPFNICSIAGNKAYFGWPFGGTNAPGYILGSVSNSCGTYSQLYAFQQVNCGTQGSDPCAAARAVNYFTISPNPASDQITIGVSNRPAPVECNGMKALTTTKGICFSTVNVYNSFGTLVKSYKTASSKNATLQISNLITGNYVVEIIEGDYIEKQQLIVQ